MILFAQRKNPALVFTQEVKAPDVFTPFGNGVRVVVKFGDDGSQVVEDNSGILLWGRRGRQMVHMTTRSIEGSLNKPQPLMSVTAELIPMDQQVCRILRRMQNDAPVVSLTLLVLMLLERA